MTRQTLSKQPITITVHILALADRHAHPYNNNNSTPKHTFPLRLLPDTLIREACFFAAEHLRTAPLNTVVVDSTRFEARDREGFVFSGQEAIGQELGDGGEVFLVEDAVEGVRWGERLRDRFEAVLSDKEAARTPCKNDKDKVKQPRVTPSQRALMMAQGARSEPRKTPARTPLMRRAVKSEVKVRGKRRSMSTTAPMEIEDRSPSVAPVDVPPQPSKGATKSDEMAKSTEKSSTDSGAANSRISAQRPATKDESENPVDFLQDSAFIAKTLGQKRRFISQQAQEVHASEQPIEVIEDSPPNVQSTNKHNSATERTDKDDAPVESIESNKESSRIVTCSKPGDAVAPPPTDKVDASPTAVAQQRSQPSSILTTSFICRDSQRVIPDSQESPAKDIDDNDAPKRDPIRRRSTSSGKIALKSVISADTVKQEQEKQLQSYLDPYDISGAFSDEDSNSPRRFTSPIRKLGSARKHPIAMSSSGSNKSPSMAKTAIHSSKPPKRPTAAVPTLAEAIIPSTPHVRAPASLPAVGLSSAPPGPLLSSPTNHVAAALAKGRAKARRQPYPEGLVIEDSSDDLYDVLVDARDTSSPPRRHGGSQSLEFPLPWSAPPLRVETSRLRRQGEDPFWTCRTTGRRSPTGRKGLKERENPKDGVGTSGELEPRENAAGLRRESPNAQILPANAISSFNLGSPVKKTTMPAMPADTKSHTPVKPSLQLCAGKSPLLLVHGSSSSEQEVEQIGLVDNMEGAKSQPVSPSKIIDTVVIDDSSSRDGVESEETLEVKTKSSLRDDGMLNHSDRQKHGAGEDEADLMSGALLSGEEADEAIGSDKAVSGYNQDNLLDKNPPSSLDIEKPLPIAATWRGDYGQPEGEPLPLTRVPESDPMSDYVELETPPSAQVSKRKRELSEDLDSAEERARHKKARHEARDAKKAEQKRLREEKKAQEEEKLGQQEAWQQQERKRLALETAHRRALDLEIVVSSPTKAAEMGLSFSDIEDSNEENEIGSSPTVLSDVFRRLLEEDDNNASQVSSEESDGRVSWRELSKRHFSASPSFSQAGAADISDVAVIESVTGRTEADTHSSNDKSDPTQVQLVQEATTVEAQVLQSQQRLYNSSIFQEAIMSTGAYSPFETHNRIHLQMLNASLLAKALLAKPQSKGSSIKPAMQSAHCDKGPVRPELGCDVLVKSEPTTSGCESDNCTTVSVGQKEASRLKAMLRPTLKVKKLSISEPEIPVKSEIAASRSASEDHTDSPTDEDDEAEITRHSIRSPAPSPEIQTPASAEMWQKKQRNKQRNADRAKNQRRKQKDRARKKRKERKDQPGVCTYKAIRERGLKNGAQGRTKPESNRVCGTGNKRCM
ncbi:unnamed protein product [Discula destructiva]